jgi:thiamine biosynthesis lipoprotein
MQRISTPWLRVILLSACAVLPSCADRPAGRFVTLTGATMGTTYRITTGEPRAGVSRADLERNIEGILERINGEMSTYDDTSELTRFNRRRTTEWVSVSPGLVAVMREALEVSELTGGAFDVTVGPVVDLWGFGPEPRGEGLPTDREIEVQLERVGYQHIHARRSPPALRKDRPDVEVDLSAIAKGYAVDQLAGYLQSTGVRDLMVEIGGEVHTSGRSPDGTPWRIGIEMPLTDGRAIQRVVLLEDGALATSGDYRKFIERDGTRFSHTIDPRTGWPVEHDLASVSVLSESSMRADALATGLVVLGPGPARELAAREDLATLFIFRDPDGFREAATPAMARALVTR